VLFPELEALPHADTVFRLLRDIDVENIEQAHIEQVCGDRPEPPQKSLSDRVLAKLH
jgi:hypothetical protein